MLYFVFYTNGLIDFKLLPSSNSTKKCLIGFSVCTLNSCSFIERAIVIVLMATLEQAVLPAGALEIVEGEDFRNKSEFRFDGWKIIGVAEFRANDSSLNQNNGKNK